jgi:dCMP deaminase
LTKGGKGSKIREPTYDNFIDMKKVKRLTKEQYYLNIAREVSLRSTCLMISFGCIIVKNDQIISTGYVGAPRKTKDCLDLGYCIRRKNNVESGKGYEMCRSVHAEMNAIINAARAGVSLLGGDIYLYTAKKEQDGYVPVDAYPCLLCKKMIINSGIKNFIGNDAKGKICKYKIEDWINDWKKLDDITKDAKQYKVNYSKRKK